MKRRLIFSAAVAIVCRAFASLSGAEWISVPDAPVFPGPVKGDSRAASGTSWFARVFTNSGEVLAWMYRTMAGISADSSAPGFKRIVMSPKPDRRLGWVKAEYRSVSGLVKSSWRYEGDEWVWKFAVPEGSLAQVTFPGETESKDFPPGTYTIRRSCR